ncbi:MAG: YihY/virulence factor BrkB family protein [Hyphomicrobiaceae bacterium]
MIGALRLGQRVFLVARSISRAPVNPGAGAKQKRQSKSRLAVGKISSCGCSGRSRKIGSYPLPAAWRSSRYSPSSPGSRLSYRCTDYLPDASTIGNHLSLLSGFLPGGVLQLIAEQITLISRQGNETLGTAFVAGLLIALASANSGMAALFDALNVVYNEREKRSLVRFYATTFLFTFAGIVFVIIAITGVVVLPLMLKFVGLASTTEWLFAILRWPILFMTLVVSLACIYRYGPSRRDARWRWVTWGSILGALLWIAASSLFSWYVATFDSYNATYGSLGAGVGFMVWLWLSAVIVLLGGEINAEMEHQTARDTTEGGSKPLGSRGAMMADHVGEAQV